MAGITDDLQMGAIRAGKTVGQAVAAPVVVLGQTLLVGPFIGAANWGNYFVNRLRDKNSSFGEKVFAYTIGAPLGVVFGLLAGTIIQPKRNNLVGEGIKWFPGVRCMYKLTKNYPKLHTALDVTSWREAKRAYNGLTRFFITIPLVVPLAAIGGIFYKPIQQGAKKYEFYKTTDSEPIALLKAAGWGLGRFFVLLPYNMYRGATDGFNIAKNIELFNTSEKKIIADAFVENMEEVLKKIDLLNNINSESIGDPEKNIIHTTMQYVLGNIQKLEELEKVYNRYKVDKSEDKLLWEQLSKEVETAKKAMEDLECVKLYRTINPAEDTDDNKIKALLAKIKEEEEKLKEHMSAALYAMEIAGSKNGFEIKSIAALERIGSEMGFKPSSKRHQSTGCAEFSSGNILKTKTFIQKLDGPGKSHRVSMNGRDLTRIAKAIVGVGDKEPKITHIGSTEKLIQLLEAISKEVTVERAKSIELSVSIKTMVENSGKEKEVEELLNAIRNGASEAVFEANASASAPTAPNLKNRLRNGLSNRFGRGNRKGAEEEPTQEPTQEPAPAAAGAPETPASVAGTEGAGTPETPAEALPEAAPVPGATGGGEDGAEVPEAPEIIAPEAGTAAPAEAPKPASVEKKESQLDVIAASFDDLSRTNSREDPAVPGRGYAKPGSYEHDGSYKVGEMTKLYPTYIGACLKRGKFPNVNSLREIDDNEHSELCRDRIIPPYPSSPPP